MKHQHCCELPGHPLKLILIFLSIILITETGWGQSSITAFGMPVIQNFDGLSSAGTWSNNTTLVGWYAQTDATSG